MISVLIEAIDKIKKNDKAGAEWKESALQPSVTLSRLMSDYQMKSVKNKNNHSDDEEEDYEVKIAELWSRKVGKFRLTWFALKTWQIWYFPRESWGENTMGGDFFIDAAALQCFSGDSGDRSTQSDNQQQFYTMTTFHEVTLPFRCTQVKKKVHSKLQSH